MLFGIDQPSAGRIRLDGEEVSFADPAAAMRAGIVYVSEDRLGQSLVMEFSILANASLPVIGKTTLAGLVMRRREIAVVEPHLRRLRLKFRGFDQLVRTLSGGNQQKVVLSKWLATYSAGPHSRRTDAGDRRPEQIRGARNHCRACASRHGDHPHLFRAA